MAQVNVAQFDGDMPPMQMPVAMQTGYHQEDKPEPQAGQTTTTSPLSHPPEQATPVSTEPRM